ncbi:hypothetical protein [Paractinoplanes rishiriensis]|uniref:Uncharacterized protein n=1 Tax=Paractinoplanes rishiriensis TaxID=1050105 RepID=A0A919KAA8_9ACTN|nr:hypothetical protein [Actinoplanes rishiriensis]GIE99536.1 hypothetical protein Ari01nite_70010 [Actinoplanes rishiriensis]
MRTRGPVPLTTAVVGVGALFLPALTVEAFGAVSVAGWLVHLPAGLLLVLALAPHAGPSSGGPAGLTGAAFGAPAAAAVRWWYLIGVTVGQAVVAAVGGAFVAQAVGRPTVTLPAALLILVLAAGLGAVRAEVPVRWSRLALPVTVGCAALAVRPADLAPVADGGWPRTAALVVFAFVGWEATLRLDRPRTRTVVAAVLLVGLVYLGGVLLALAEVPQPPRPIAAAGAAVCVLACVRNLSATAGLFAGDRPPGTRAYAAVVAGTVAAVGVVLLATRHTDLFDLLSVPAAMGLAVFASTAAAAAVLGTGARRIAGAVAALIYVSILPFAGPAGIAPLVVLAACTVAHLRGGSHAVDQSRFIRRLSRRCRGRSRDRVRDPGSATALDAARDHPGDAAGAGLVPGLRRSGRGRDRRTDAGAG